MTSINNGTLTNDNGITQIDPNPLFGESITYEGTSPVSATPQYNGNISGITWRNKIEQTGLPGLTTVGQGYLFNYDDVNWLTQRSYYTQSDSTFTQSASNALTKESMVMMRWAILIRFNVGTRTAAYSTTLPTPITTSQPATSCRP